MRPQEARPGPRRVARPASMQRRRVGVGLALDRDAVAQRDPIACAHAHWAAADRADHGQLDEHVVASRGAQRSTSQRTSGNQREQRLDELPAQRPVSDAGRQLRLDQPDLRRQQALEVPRSCLGARVGRASPR